MIYLFSNEVLREMKKYNLITVFNNKYFYYHILYWIINVLFFTLVFSSKSNFENFWIAIHENVAYLPGGMLFTYISVNYLIPQFFFRNNIPVYITLQIIIFLLYPIFSNAVRVFYIDPMIYNIHSEFRIERSFNIILILIFDFVPLAGVKILKQLRIAAVQNEKNKHEKTEAELKLREAELKLLKSQIHPHFLFNTLNNLYSLSIQKSKKTSEVIIKVSDLLNYIIYDCRSEKVSLDKELEFINSYIELEKIRYDESLKLIVSISGSFQEKDIAPMILHTFIENSFKHGASKTTDNPWIDIYLTVNNEYLTFKIANNKANDIPNSKSVSGIGIKNAQKRLELIYPNKHKLEIIETESVYSVFLEIQL